MQKKDPFREAEAWTKCPDCGAPFGWNKEDGLTGQRCSCGHVFTEKEKRIKQEDVNWTEL